MELLILYAKFLKDILMDKEKSTILLSILREQINNCSFEEKEIFFNNETEIEDINLPVMYSKINDTADNIVIVDLNSEAENLFGF